MLLVQIAETSAALAATRSCTSGYTSPRMASAARTCSVVSPAWWAIRSTSRFEMDFFKLASAGARGSRRE